MKLGGRQLVDQLGVFRRLLGCVGDNPAQCPDLRPQPLLVHHASPLGHYTQRDVRLHRHDVPHVGERAKVSHLTFAPQLAPRTCGQKRTQDSPARCGSGRSLRQFRMAYSVHFAEDVDVSAELRTRAFQTLADISETLESIPSRSAFWSAANSGLAELNLGGWKFEYRILHRDRRILVVAARQLGVERLG